MIRLLAERQRRGKTGMLGWTAVRSSILQGRTRGPRAHGVSGGSVISTLGALGSVCSLCIALIKKTGNPTYYFEHFLQVLITIVTHTGSKK